MKTLRAMIRAFVSRACAWGPPGPIAATALVLLAIFTAGRMAWTLLFRERIAAVPGALWLFPVGAAMDLLFIACLLAPPAVLLLALPKGRSKVVAWLTSFYLAVMIWANLVVETITPQYMIEFGSRPGRIFIEYLPYPVEVFSAIAISFPSSLVTFTIAILGGAWIAWRLARALVRDYRPWPVTRRRWGLALALAITLPLGWLGWTRWPAYKTLATFSATDHLSNALAMNSPSMVLHALFNLLGDELDGGKFYGHMDRKEIITRVRRASMIPPSTFLDPKRPFLHHSKGRGKGLRPYNVVVIMGESFGAEFVGCLGGKKITPRFDTLAQRGLLFTRLYATGDRTVRGLEAVLCAFPPTQGRAVTKLWATGKDFFCIASLLKTKGYATHFLYAGHAGFDDMGRFCRTCGFDAIHDEKGFQSSVWRTPFGVSDEALLEKANTVFRAQGKRPFFGFVLTTTNHAPYVVPEGSIQYVPGVPKNSKENGVRYLDHSIGRFFDLARREAYYENTLFLIVADHNHTTVGPGLVPVHKYHIPALILGPGVRPGRFAKIASQLDLAPTLLPLTGLALRHPMFGRDLLALPPNAKGRAICQFNDNAAYVVGDRVVVHRPHLPPSFFRLRKGRFEQAPADRELARDGLAHLLAPALVYYGGLHVLP